MQNHLDERGGYVWAASEAEALGHGGVTRAHSDRMSAATGMSRSAIAQGIAETAHPQDAAPPDRARRPAAVGKKSAGIRLTPRKKMRRELIKPGGKSGARREKTLRRRIMMLFLPMRPHAYPYGIYDLKANA
ncbi:MAG: hypothetical protein LBD58_06385 [Treponema sp.]|jgi:hypothetical protein|nr:hypothetical protein [Treponema sp.]